MTDARATWWCQLTEGVNYYRAVLPARYLPGKVNLRDSYQLSGDRSEITFPAQEGSTAIWMFPGNAVKAVLIGQMMARGVRCLVEADDNYFVPPPIDFGAWRRDEVNGHEHSYESHRQIVPQTDGVIVSTPALEREYRELHNRVFVCPNMVDPTDWPDDEPEHQPEGVLRIGWAASDSHAVDAPLIERALKWASEQDGVEVVIVGITLWQPRFRHRFIPYAPMAEYRRNLENIDVMLCPLKPGRWADCKSDVKALEAAMAGACSVVSRRPPYAPWFDGPAMVADDDYGFLRAVKHLVRHRDETRDMAEKARRYALNERSIQGNVWRYEEACAEVALAA